MNNKIVFLEVFIKIKIGFGSSSYLKKKSLKKIKIMDTFFS